MKRLALRIAALGTVGALGLVAISQAQRGAEDLPLQAGSLAFAATQSAAAGQPLAGENQLRATASTDPRENPLRAQSPSNQQTLLPNILTTSHLETTAPIEPAADDLPPGIPSPDPFRLNTDRTAKGLTPRHSEFAEVVGESLSAPVSDTPPQHLPSQTFPDVADPAGSGAIEGHLRPSSAEAPPGGAPLSRYLDYQPRPQGTSGTPAPGPDPLAAPSDFSSAYRSAPSPYAPQPTPDLTTDRFPASDGTGQPGNSQLEGPQSPQLTIQKSAPQSIQVGQLATFRVTIQNTGRVAANQVQVLDQVPRGARLISTTPRASRDPGGQLVWTLGTLRPSEESSVQMQLEPIAEGEIGSVATVRFQADASARSVVTKPELVLQTSALSQVLCGEQITLTVDISNRGTGIAKDVVLEEHIPAGLEHPAGPALEYNVGDLPPGESRRLELTLLAKNPGPVANVLTARGQGNVTAEDRLDIEIVAPLLQVALDGPSRRYLEREATYQLSIHNPGTASARQVQLAAYLPEGLKFLSANNSGHYEEATRMVYWALEELPTSAVGTVELTALPVEPGRHTIRVHSTADRGVSADGQHEVLVEGIAAIKFVVVDVTDPIEIGGETTYEIHVVNQGSKAATNVLLAVLLPPEMRPITGEGPTRHLLQGNRVLFEALPRLAPKADTTYRVRAQGLAPGDLRICAELLTDDMHTPVAKEESTRVYSDE